MAIPTYRTFSTRAPVRALAGLTAAVTAVVAVVAIASFSAPEAPATPTTVAAASIASVAASAPAGPVIESPTDEARIAEAAAARAELARRQRHEHIAAASRSAHLPTLGWPSNGPLSGWWGERRGPRGHVGLDIDGESGDPIVSAGAGVVEWAGPAPTGYGGYGLMVLVRHGGGVQTLYAHLSSIAVAPEAVVEAGELIGTMGTTGNVTGSHLHFEVRLNGLPVDPGAWLPAR